MLRTILFVDLLRLFSWMSGVYMYCRAHVSERVFFSVLLLLFLLRPYVEIVICEPSYAASRGFAHTHALPWGVARLAEGSFSRDT